MENDAIFRYGRDSNSCDHLSLYVNNTDGARTSANGRYVELNISVVMWSIGLCVARFVQARRYNSLWH
jgi:hypothetical protein